MWDLPGPGLEPVSPALAGVFLTTAPPGKPRGFCFKMSSFLKERIGMKRCKNGVSLSGDVMPHIKTDAGFEKGSVADPGL